MINILILNAVTIITKSGIVDKILVFGEIGHAFESYASSSFISPNKINFQAICLNFLENLVSRPVR